jgi:hypothetical protein
MDKPQTYIVAWREIHSAEMRVVAASAAEAIKMAEESGWDSDYLEFSEMEDPPVAWLEGIQQATGGVEDSDE